ncbi:hypothetical protein O181_074190 [Austropuccinia psidii MF-1]|uniref:Uncharacterized protein n=1 Tax=Austropuccinia psidii MF-1 TaxID=1389203 RepID=A0A9Q3ICS0_9BASI|nr:hypothetical protein [Austropuccinia psidii MF-1]
MFPSRNKIHTPQSIVELEDSPSPVKRIIKDRKRRLNGKDHRQHLVSVKNQTSDKDKWLAEDAITDGDLNLGMCRASRSLQSIINDYPCLEGGYVSLCLKTRTQA